MATTRADIVSVKLIETSIKLIITDIVITVKETIMVVNILTSAMIITIICFLDKKKSIPLFLNHQ